MKKFLISIVVLLLLGSVGFGFASYQLGSHAQEMLNASLDRAAESQYMNVIENKFEQGLFTSRAKTVIEINTEALTEELNMPPKQTEKPVLLTFYSTIRHHALQGELYKDDYTNPLIVKVFSRLEADKESKLFGEKTPLKALIKLYFNGEKEMHIHSPSAELAKNTNAHQLWGGAKGKVTSNKLDDDIVLNLDLPRILLATPTDAGSMEVQKVKLNGHFYKKQGSTLLGNIEFTTQHYSFKNNKTNALRLDGMRIASTTDLTEGLLMSSTQISLKKLAMAANVMNNPDAITAQSFMFKAELNRLDPVAVNNLEQELEKVKSQGLPDEMLRPLVMAALMKHGVLLLKKSPEIKFSIGFDTTEGNIAADAAVKYQAKSNAGFSLLSLITELSGSGTVKMPASLMKLIFKEKAKTAMTAQMALTGAKPSPEAMAADIDNAADQQLQQILAMGFLEENGKYVNAHITYKGGKLALNGKRIPLPIPMPGL